LICQYLKVNRSSIYYSSVLEVKDKLLSEQIECIQAKHPFYGYPRITLELNNRLNDQTKSGSSRSKNVHESLKPSFEVKSINHKRVYRIMCKFGLKALSISKKLRKKDDEKFRPVNIPNLLKPAVSQNLLIKPDQIWSSDFTHLWFNRGWLYLFTVIDTFTREIVGFNLVSSATSNVVKVTLNQAINRYGQPEIFHSDQGSQYRAYETTSLLEKLNINISMSAKSSPWENGRQERFYNGFKAELKHRVQNCKLNELNTVVSLDLSQFYELICKQIDYYNNHRIHTSLKTSPAKFRQKWYDENRDRKPVKNI
jgi:putative transposase